MVPLTHTDKLWLAPVVTEQMDSVVDTSSDQRPYQSVYPHLKSPESVVSSQVLEVCDRWKLSPISPCSLRGQGHSNSASFMSKKRQGPPIRKTDILNRTSVQLKPNFRSLLCYRFLCKQRDVPLYTMARYAVYPSGISSELTNLASLRIQVTGTRGVTSGRYIVVLGWLALSNV
ncbi:hypothetical protein RRG08_025845 [Elysia crispata]|uniref:Uncharacterized protein n=1 Tax=Elysia crispata TaxID=231223 RepID=A0AAE0Y3I6_9GAST|nr:hypothetical protein RRG08_025845 [Elysia crispata]